MAFKIDTFKSNISGRGSYSFTRSNLFEISIEFPGKIGNSAATAAKQQMEFLGRAAAVPSYTQGTVEVPFRGRTLKIAGDRTYEPFTVTIMNTQDHQLRNAFEKWASILQFETHNFATSAGLGGNGMGVFGKAEVSLLRRNKKDEGEDYKIMRTYTMHNIWPSSVSAVDLDWGNNDAVQEFTVEFQVQYVTAGKDKTEAKDAKGDELDAEQDPDTGDN